MTEPASHPAALVLSEDAAEYRALLRPLDDQGVRIDYADSPDVVLSLGGDHTVMLAQPQMAAAVIDQLPEVQWVQSTWAGITPLLHTARQDFLLTGVKEVFDERMAEYTLGHILAHELRLAERREQQAQKSWWEQPSGQLRGKTLGVMGTGSIGAHIARTARCFGLNPIGFNRSGFTREEFSQVFRDSELSEFLQHADYVVAVLPDTPQTTGLMNAEHFAAMKRSALFINIGRGNLVDERALEQALRNGQLAGAVLDVFHSEPLSADSPLWTTPGLVVTGHVAARSRPQDIAEIFINNYQRFVQQRTLSYLVDRQRGY